MAMPIDKVHPTMVKQQEARVVMRERKRTTAVANRNTTLHCAFEQRHLARQQQQQEDTVHDAMLWLTTADKGFPSPLARQTRGFSTPLDAHLATRFRCELLSACEFCLSDFAETDAQDEGGKTLGSSEVQ